MNRADSYIRRKEKRKELAEKIKDQRASILASIDEDGVALSSLDMDYSYAEKVHSENKAFYHFDPVVVVTDAEAREFLKQFKDNYNRQCFENMISQCKREVISTIVKPFGLGHIVAAYDKVGGNVDTVHNARQGVYATEKEEQRYKDLGQYDSKRYHTDGRYVKINAKHSADKESGRSVDYMTGKNIDPYQKTDLDHIVSAREIHHDPGRVLAGIDGRELANTEYNLALTDRSLNRSKKANTMSEFIEGKNKRLEKISELRAKPYRTPQEQSELDKLERLRDIDDERVRAADKASRREIDGQINKTYYGSEKFAKSVAETGVKEGSMMGLQQAIGTIIVEFFSLLFDEAIDIYNNGFKTSSDDQSFLNALRTRIERIGTKLKDRWKDLAARVAYDGIFGFVSGFISNLVTVVVNMFFTTCRRVGRIIREGIFSLFKAVKLLIFPPKGMTFGEALHEAKKLVVTGVIVAAGVFLEGPIDILVKGVPFLGTIDLSSILIGSLTAFAVALAVYHIDKKKNDEKAIQEMIKQAHEEYDRTIALLDSRL